MSKKFRNGKLVARSLIGHLSSGYDLWIASCDCGNFIITDMRGKSCGCSRLGMSTKHGLTGHRLYRVWLGMKERCSNPKHSSFTKYGGAGIGVCQEWSEDAGKFIEWCITNGWRPGLSVDRKDNDLGYSPDNCRIIPRGDQNRNKKNNLRIAFEGKVWILSDLAKHLKIDRHKLSEVYKSGNFEEYLNNRKSGRNH